MRISITALGFALLMLCGTSALAKPAPGINCGQLGTAIHNVDDALEARCVNYNSLGDLLSTALLDPTVDPNTGLTQGETLVRAVNFFYGGNPGAPFTSVKQILNTIASCGLTPHLIAEVNDFNAVCP